MAMVYFGISLRAYEVMSQQLSSSTFKKAQDLEYYKKNSERHLNYEILVRKS